MQATKEFITTVILGKDMVPRLGMVQMEKLRNEIMETLKNTTKPKWQILGTLCCYKCTSENNSHFENETNSPAKTTKNETILIKNSSINTSIKNLSNNETIVSEKMNLSVCISSPLPQVTSSTKNVPLYPPGRILHVVRKYPKLFQLKKKSTNVTATADSNYSTRLLDDKEDVTDVKSKPFSIFKSFKRSATQRLSAKKTKQQVPVYQIIETENTEFNELLISPRMLQDHMPDNLIKCMKAVLEDRAPQKPPRQKLSFNDLNENFDKQESYEEINFKDMSSLHEYSQIDHDERKPQSQNTDPHAMSHEKQQSKTRSFSFLQFNKNVSFLKQYGQNFLTRSSKASKTNKNQLLNEEGESLKISNKSQMINQLAASSLQNISESTRKSQLVAVAAPLAAPESISDLANNLDESNNYEYLIDENSLNRNEKHFGENNKTNTNKRENLTYDLYYDDSINLKNPAFHLHHLIRNNNHFEEEEIKSNLAWWPYPENNNQLNPQLMNYSTSGNNNQNNLLNYNLNSFLANLSQNNLDSNNQSVDIEEVDNIMSKRKKRMGKIVRTNRQTSTE